MRSQLVTIDADGLLGISGGQYGYYDDGPRIPHGTWTDQMDPDRGRPYYMGQDGGRPGYDRSMVNEPPRGMDYPMEMTGPGVRGQYYNGWLDY